MVARPLPRPVIRHTRMDDKARLQNKNMASADLALPNDYRQTLEALKQRVHQAQLQARRTINTELIQLY